MPQQTVNTLADSDDDDGAGVPENVEEDDFDDSILDVIFDDDADV